MKITYLGHAGFCVETASSIIVMDPWLSSEGAFDSAWYQYPKNHHMADYVRDLFDASPKNKYIYISHEHKDHFDLEFLNTLWNRDFTLFLANFRRPVVKETLDRNNFKCKEIIGFNDSDTFRLGDVTLTFFIIDEEIDCDSAILLKTDTKSFLNLNDCKLDEMLPSILENYGKIDVFATQFSGAIWFPICYDIYSKEQYERISASKALNKFRATADAISVVKPAVYLPSAGPPCFLDPLLIEKNFEKINIFPRAPQLIEYLESNCEYRGTKWPEIMPGDILDTETLKFVKLAEDRVKDDEFEKYVRSYANEFKEHFHKREIENKKVNPQQVFLDLKEALEYKVDQLRVVNEDVDTLLYWCLSDYSDRIYKINFKEKTVTAVEKIENVDNFIRIATPAWQVKKVLTKEIDWADFALTFRVKLARNPDTYQHLIHGYITIDAEGLGHFCDLLKKHHEKTQRIVIEFEGKKYSVLRYCPHQGGDLKNGWIEHGCLVCPRHRWKFDIIKNGKCIYNNETIDSICVNENSIIDSVYVNEKNALRNNSEKEL
jgi:UDP-MurNAc hydroxylase